MLNRCCLNCSQQHLILKETKNDPKTFFEGVSFYLDFWVAKSVIEFIWGVVVTTNIDHRLSSVDAFGRCDVAVAGEFHFGEVHAHGRQLVHVIFLLFGKAQNIKSLL